MTIFRRWFAWLFFVIVMMTNLAHASEFENPWNNWLTRIDRNHPHVGKIWSVADNKFISHRKLIEELATADFRLLGETHDNPDHHRLQAWVIGKIVGQGKHPAIIFEMIERNQSTALQDYLANPDAGAAGLGAALGWKERGWPDWSIYQPIAEAAMELGLKINFGNENRTIVREMAVNGLESLGADRLEDLKLDIPLSEPLGTALSSQIVEAHCDMLPQDVATAMAGAQRLRDAVMAEQMVLNGGAGDAVLIAGSGHARTDRGVPWYLARRAPGKKTLSLMFVEAKDDLNLRDMIPLNPDHDPAADYFWFTPRAERPDPCEEMRRLIDERGSE